VQDIVIVSAARTGVGKFGGSLSKLSATELGSLVVREVVTRSGLDPALVGEQLRARSVLARRWCTTF